ncbi:MAG: hypothetical protein LUC45_03895 [Paraprevotella sp.]|nr:hypothetical protein [Paraprevotella sp.]
MAGNTSYAEGERERPADDTDVTDWIVNSSFDDGNTDGWTSDFDLDASRGYAALESNPWYKPTFDFYQEIELPNGEYSLSVQEHATIGNKAVLYMESAYQRMEADMNWNQSPENWTDEDISRISTDAVLVVDGKVRIGVNQHTGNQSQKLYFDNFKLRYINDGSEKMKADYSAKVDELGEISDYPDALQSKVETLKNSVNEITPDNFWEKYNALSPQIAYLTSGDMRTLKTLFGWCTSLCGETKDESVKSALTQAMEQANASLASAASAEDVADINTALKAEFDAVSSGFEYVADLSDFSNGNAVGWEGSVPSPEAGVEEFYQNDFDFHKTLTGLPEGWYRMTVNAFCRAQAADGGAAHSARTENNTWRVYGNGYELPLMCVYEETGTTGGDNGFPTLRNEANANFEAGKYQNTVDVWVKDGVLKLGFSNSEYHAGGWCCFDNVKVVYKGVDRSAMYEAMSEQALADAAKVNDAYVAFIKEQVAEHLSEGDAGDVEALNAVMGGYAELTNAVAKFNSEGVMADYRQKQTEALAVSESSPAVKDTYVASLSEAETALSSVISAEAVDRVKDGLEQAYWNYLFAADPTNGNHFDFTALLTNPSVRTYPVGKVDGWYNDIRQEYFGVQSNAAYQGETDPSCGEFVESWSPAALKPTDEGNGWLIYQKVALPEGAYKLTAAAFTDRPANADAAVTGVPSAYLSAGRGAVATSKGEAVVDKVLTYKSLSFYLNEASTADNPTKLGLFVEGDNEADWFGITDMKLYKEHLAAQSLSLDESESYSVKSDAYADVKLARALKTDQWNTFCVPFDMTAEQLSDNHITEVRRLNPSVTEKAGTLTLTFDAVETVEAGVPYLVKVDEAYNGTICVDKVTVKSGDPMVLECTAGVSMKGIYSATSVPLGAFFIHDDMFYVADKADVSLKGYRAYVTLEKRIDTVNRLFININGHVTSVEGVSEGLTSDGDKRVDVYTLSGVRVKGGVKKANALDGLRKGFYIVDGTKEIKY